MFQFFAFKRNQLLGIIIVLILILLSCSKDQPNSSGKQVLWEAINTPQEFQGISSMEEQLFGLTDSVLYKSIDYGSTWEQLTGNEFSGKLRGVEVDGDVIYLFDDNFVYSSYDQGQTFSRCSDFIYDYPIYLDFEAGAGWLVVSSWGADSGPNRVVENCDWESARGDLIYTYLGVLRMIIADVNSPEKVAYIWGKRGDSGYKCFKTKDRGASWIEMEEKVLFSTIINGRGLTFSETQMSSDQGETWEPFAYRTKCYTYDHSTGLVCGLTPNGAVYIYDFAKNASTVLERDIVFSSIHAYDGFLYALSENQRLFRACLTDFC